MSAVVNRCSLSPGLSVTNIQSLPLEIFLEITEYLSPKELLALRQCSKVLDHKTKDTHLKRIYHTQRYYLTLNDLEALLRLARTRPSVTSRLKHLILEYSIPYIVVDRNHGGKIFDQTENKYKPQWPPEWHRQFSEICESALWDYWATISTKVYNARLPRIFSKLPNLETIEFRNTYNGDIPTNIILSHYPKIRPLGDDLEAAFVRFYRRFSRPVASARSGPFESVMRGLESTPQLRLKEIRFHENCRSTFRGIPLYWFDKNMPKVTFWQTIMQNLKVFDVYIGTITNLTSMVDDTPRAQRAVASFLDAAGPAIEELSIVAGGVNSISRIRDCWQGRYPLYTPNILLDTCIPHFSHLRKLSLVNHIFPELHLKTLLLNHKDTLRSLYLVNCLLLGQHQFWSRIFRLLESDLTLHTFEYEATGFPHLPFLNTVTQIPSDEWFCMEKFIPWFRVYGDVRTDNHRCELLPKDLPGLKKSPYYRGMSYPTAMGIIDILEREYISRPWTVEELRTAPDFFPTSFQFVEDNRKWVAASDEGSYGYLAISPERIIHTINEY
ncbi:hypothetical protein TWF694_006933 [Orbilia ellipsospora]|uniref:F-box domain-containing protein n=1 Tax=Orbilia ellipsospora TaxID=2528407 RepID=A0AAV9XLN2_9PEZI